MKRKLYITLLSLLFITCLVTGFFSRFNREPELEIYPNQSYERTITVVADENYPPFSFVNEEGVSVGGDI